MAFEYTAVSVAASGECMLGENKSPESSHQGRSCLRGAREGLGLEGQIGPTSFFQVSSSTLPQGES